MTINIKGIEVLIDDEDLEIITSIPWYANNQSEYIYFSYDRKIDGKRSILQLHRFVIKCNDKNKIVDHINGNTLDNRKCNLRICTKSQNAMNSKIGKNNTSGYKGVYFSKRDKLISAYITVNKKRIIVGYFKTLKEAAKARDMAAIMYHGEFARLNFPEEQNGKI